jgi:hypothetical protein
MPKIIFTPEELAYYFDPTYKSEIGEKSKEFETEFRIHADGIFPEKIISQARPNESTEVFNYRKTIWQPKTKPSFNKVFSSLQKIRRSSDWSVKFNEVSFKIPEGETLEEYLTELYPKFESLEKYMFDVWLREYLIDPNAVCAVFPGEAKEETEFSEPIAEIFNSGLVVFFKSEDFVILKNPLGSTYKDEQGHEHTGDSYYILTTTQYLKYDQKNVKRDFKLVSEIPHEIGYLPAWKLGGVLIKSLDGELLYESKIAGMLPELDEAVREYSDLQAAVIMNIFPERWEMATAECNTCHGTGKITNQGDPSGFTSCNNPSCVAGYVVSPYSKVLVKPAEIGQQMAIPPVGYVEKPVEIVELQDKRVEKHIYNALAAINMQFLSDVPLVESGLAKGVDRDEASNFVHSVAEDLVNSMEQISYNISILRFGVQHSEEEIEELQPEIHVPEHFDIFSIKIDEEELQNAKTNKLNPAIINEMEIEYANKKFAGKPEVQRKLAAVLTLDPLANVSEDDKGMRLTNNGVTQDDYILSCNINSFVERAISEDENFLVLDTKQQKEVLLKYVAEVTKKTTLNGQLQEETEEENEEVNAGL